MTLPSRWDGKVAIWGDWAVSEHKHQCPECWNNHHTEVATARVAFESKTTMADIAARDEVRASASFDALRHLPLTWDALHASKCRHCGCIEVFHISGGAVLRISAK